MATWDCSPIWYFMAECEGQWGPAWWAWWTTGGEQGEEPPDDVKAYYAKMASVIGYAPAEARQVFDEAYAMIGDNYWIFIPSVNDKQARIVSAKMGNVDVSEDAFSSAFTHQHGVGILQGVGAVRSRAGIDRRCLARYSASWAGAVCPGTAWPQPPFAASRARWRSCGEDWERPGRIVPAPVEVGVWL